MNKFKQHIPSFVDRFGEELPVIEFSTTQELLEIDVVKQWKKPMDGKLFSHFAIKDNALMVIHDDGFHWWVVGYVEDPLTIDLPMWDGPKYEKEEKGNQRF